MRVQSLARANAKLDAFEVLVKHFGARVRCRQRNVDALLKSPAECFVKRPRAIARCHHDDGRHGERNCGCRAYLGRAHAEWRRRWRCGARSIGSSSLYPVHLFEDLGLQPPARLIAVAAAAARAAVGATVPHERIDFIKEDDRGRGLARGIKERARGLLRLTPEAVQQRACRAREEREPVEGSDSLREHRLACARRPKQEHAAPRSSRSCVEKLGNDKRQHHGLVEQFLRAAQRHDVIERDAELAAVPHRLDRVALRRVRARALARVRTRRRRQRAAAIKPTDMVVRTARNASALTSGQILRRQTHTSLLHLLTRGQRRHGRSARRTDRCGRHRRGRSARRIDHRAWVKIPEALAGNCWVMARHFLPTNLKLL